MEADRVGAVDGMALLLVTDGQALGALGDESDWREADAPSSGLPGLVCRGRDVGAFGAPALFRQVMGWKGIAP